MTQTTAHLVRAAATGDRAAFEMLVSLHAAMVTGVAYSVCGDFLLSEDIGQEAFIEAWKNLATLREPEKFPGWICTFARRRAIDAVRSAKSTRADCSLDSMPFEVHDHKQLTPEASMSQEQERELVWSMHAGHSHRIVAVVLDRYAHGALVVLSPSNLYLSRVP